jgi:hypothetical protein
MPNRDPDQPYLKHLEGISFNPVFILGLHRSGTSILYKTLTATNQFNPITAYHIIRYHELLYHHHHQTETQAKNDLNRLLQDQGLIDRGIDRLTITADFPEEYGFLLGHQALQQKLTPRNLALFTQLGNKIQYLAGNHRPLLAKNPYDFPNFLYLKTAFPTARFVFIHRHPLKTLSSTLKALQVLIQHKNPYTEQLAPPYTQFSDNPLLRLPIRAVFRNAPELATVILTRMAAHATTYYLDNVTKLPKDSYISVTYEQFCSQSRDTLERIMQTLGMKNTIDPNTLIQPRESPIHPTIQKLSPYIMHVMHPYCETFSYTSPAISVKHL